MKMILVSICLLLAVCSLAYGVLIRAVGSGTHFYLVWLGIACIFAALAVAVKMELLLRLPVAVRMLSLCVLFICLVIFIVVEGQIANGMKEKKTGDVEYLIVLGAQVYENGPSVVLKYRLDKAISYMQEHPEVSCVVSGGQGYMEPITEAEGMARYMTGQGIASERILLEDQATTTKENIEFSRKLLPEHAKVGIVTNDFHIFRAMQIARKNGFLDAQPIVAGSTPLYLPNNMLREFFGEIKYLIFG